ncbi:MAG: TetR/AcrR family transcriptional regulator [Bacteroidales bacterium]|nr:TetR/AcrR family transcriptional regulator [Bacteroidales bacterium]
MDDELSAILKKVLFLYRKYGIRSVTMDDVSHELGISKKTLYQYVRDKDALVRQVIELEMSSQLNLLIDSCKEDLNAIEELVEIARCINYMLKEYSAVAEYDLKKYYPDLYIMLRKVRKERILKFILDNMVKGKNEGLYRENMNIDILSRISLSHIDSMFDSEVITITEFLERPFFLEYFEYHLRGIVNASGLKILEDQLQKLEDSK